MKKEVRCDVCGKLKVDGQDHNANPLLYNGRCCGLCNSAVLILRQRIHETLNSLKK